MKKRLIALLLALCASAAPAQTFSSGDPAAMATALTGMGYQPGAIDPNGGTPLFTVAINGLETAIVFGGCTDGKMCKYFVLVGRFTDLKDAPAEWTNARNEDYDLGKVWVGKDDRTLGFSMPVPTGGAQFSAAEMRFMLDQWAAFIAEISQSAIAAKLVK
ncbi:YbjN domain-containing protein [Sphingobium nicotianae]|uniref:YbjN domain-containing protein n=1 Tax=Sphingobium nicotianae TaxID=2782607 RepID=A0A9X1DB96_9SPHN|nr:YbjN domain-containing protein [Sphingobium nicotianae]MBT2186725.1 YbjN domain-containing protein [Sphingobium nicotianae]